MRVFLELSAFHKIHYVFGEIQSIVIIIITVIISIISMNLCHNKLSAKKCYAAHIPTNTESRLTRPSEAQDIIGSNSNAFRGEAIFHGWISLHNVSSLSHSSDVDDF